jgi:hypothetical protein
MIHLAPWVGSALSLGFLALLVLCLIAGALVSIWESIFGPIERRSRGQIERDNAQAAADAAADQAQLERYSWYWNLHRLDDNADKATDDRPQQ